MSQLKVRIEQQGNVVTVLNEEEFAVIIVFERDAFFPWYNSHSKILPPGETIDIPLSSPGSWACKARFALDRKDISVFLSSKGIEGKVHELMLKGIMSSCKFEDIVTLTVG